jgi:phage shock protein PspC (stress-responsive transcriptional regulator)
MTETTSLTGTPPLSAAGPRRLERPRDAAFKGVCAALANGTGTDLVLWRVLFVVLTFFGGLGVVLYLVAMLAIPREDEERSLGDRLLHGPDRHLEGRQLLLVLLTVVAVVSLLADSNGLLVAAVLGALGVLWWRAAQTRPAVTADTAVSPPAAPAALPAPAPVAAPRALRPTSPLAGLTASLAAVVAGGLLLVGASGGASIPAEAVLAAALGTVGLGLVAGSFLGRAPGLVVLAVLLGAALAGTLAARPALDAGIGDRTWHPTTSGSYRLGLGDATLDLRDLPAREVDAYRIAARVDVGHLLVLVPATMRVAVDARAELGDVEVFGVDSNGRRVHRQVDPAGRPQVALALSVRTGQVEVRRG